MRIKVLTPVHVGDGEEIIPWEYELAEDKRLRVYSFEKLLRDLESRLSIRTLKSLFKALEWEIRIKGFQKSLGEFLRENRLSASPLYEVETKAFLRRKEQYKGIKSFIKSLGRVYIPGTEIKGALRTIFIFGVVNRELNNGNYRSLNFLIETIQEALKNPKNLKSKKFWQKIENYFFIKGAPEQDAKYDIFKVLKVSDTSLKNPSECLYVDDITILGSRRKFFDPHELLKDGQEFELSMEVDSEYRNFLRKVYKNPYLELVNLEFLKESARTFYDYLLEEEEAFFERFNAKRALKDIERLRKALSKDEFLLRIGKHQGFLSITIMLLLKREAKNLYREFYQRVVSAPGKPPNKTRKITKEGRLLGFCSLITD